MSITLRVTLLVIVFLGGVGRPRGVIVGTMLRSPEGLEGLLHGGTGRHRGADGS